MPEKQDTETTLNKSIEVCLTIISPKNSSGEILISDN